jgi:hypothetical protein
VTSVQSLEIEENRSVERRHHVAPKSTIRGPATQFQASAYAQNRVFQPKRNE